MSDLLKSLDKSEERLFQILQSFERLTNSATRLYDLKIPAVSEEKEAVKNETSYITKELFALSDTLRDAINKMPSTISLKHNPNQTEDFLVEETQKYFQLRVRELDNLEDKYLNNQ
jgi:hypothetical protein